MLSKIIEGDRFKSPFTGTVFEVKKIHTSTVLLEDILDKDCHLITEISMLGSFYEKINKQ